MMSMEILLTELNAERAAKNEEIQRLKVHLCAKVKLIYSRVVPDSTTLMSCFAALDYYI